MRRTRRNLFASLVVSIASLGAAVVCSAYSICVTQGSCHVCRFYNQADDSYQGYVTWGC